MVVDGDWLCGSLSDEGSLVDGAASEGAAGLWLGCAEGLVGG